MIREKIKPSPINLGNNGQDLLLALGTFWSEVFPDRDVVAKLLEALYVQRSQYLADVTASLNAISRKDVQLFREELFYPLVWDSSQKREISLLYNQGAVFGFQTSESATKSGFPVGAQTKFGRGIITSKKIALPLPIDIVDLPYYISNMVHGVTKSWVNGIDYYIDHKTKSIVFLQDPFKDDLVAKSNTYDRDGNLKSLVSIWGYRAYRDIKELYKRWGSVFGIMTKSTELWKRFLNAFADSVIGGMSRETLTEMCCAVADVPIATKTGVVKGEAEETDSKLVWTDYEIWRIPLRAKNISVGSILAKGQPVTDGFELIEPGSSSVDWSKTPAISLFPEQLEPGFLSNIVFVNTVVNTEVIPPGTDNLQRTEFRFPILGSETDVSKFWKYVHDRGIESGSTIAELLDTRTTKNGQPSETDLPKTVVPARFILEMFLGQHVTLAKFNVNSFGPNAISLSELKVLLDVLSSDKSIISSVITSTLIDSIDLEDPDGDKIPSMDTGATIYKDSFVANDSSVPPTADEGSWIDLSPCVRTEGILCL